MMTQFDLYARNLLFYMTISLSVLLTSAVAQRLPPPAAPSFLEEPPSLLVFAASEGGRATCSARGTKTHRISWITSDGEPAETVPGIRHILDNGTIVFPGASGHEPQSRVHRASYRCRAEAPSGAVVSREMMVRAVTTADVSIRLHPSPTLSGNTASLTCLVSGTAAELGVAEISWYNGDSLLQPNLIGIDDRFQVAKSGTQLLIRGARVSDEYDSFTCSVRDPFTGTRTRSDPVQLIVSDPSGSIPPRLAQPPVNEITADRGKDVTFTCIIHGNPTPTISWQRTVDNRTVNLSNSNRITITEVAVVIQSLQESDAGRWTCRGTNQFGEQRIETYISVAAPLEVSILPSVQTINSGHPATFDCAVKGRPVDKMEWFLNGAPLSRAGVDAVDSIRFANSNRIVIGSVQKQHAGVYQCLVSNVKDSAQAAGELLLGDTLPEMQYTFIEQALRPNARVSLRCTASGNPPPRFTWMLDSQGIHETTASHRYTFGQYMDPDTGDVISHLNISSVRSEDGGLYTCKATNSMGVTEHKARLNVYGSPYIRFVSPIHAVAGTNISLQCPYSGYPISSVKWTRQGNTVASRGRYDVRDGILHVSAVDPSRDAGVYVCVVTSPSEELAKRDLQLVIHKPPQIAPFMFPSNVEEGSNIQASCSVMSGDQPIFFSWLKDNAPIPSTLAVEQRSVEFFSLLIVKDVSAAHSGNYTCVAANTAASANYSSQLTVKVAPQWEAEPQDTSALVGVSVSISCKAKGFPPPEVSWMKSQDGSGHSFKSVELLDPNVSILENGTLLIQSAAPANEAGYMCKASNGVGQDLSKSITVQVNEPPRFEFTSRNMSTKRGDPVTLVCDVFGDNPIQVTWTHNMNRLDANNYRIIISEARTDVGVKSQLSIGRTERLDSGLYKCQADNSYGRNELMVHLAVQEQPDPPTNVDVVEVNARSARISWKKPYDGHSPLLGYLIQHKMISTSSGMSAVDSSVDSRDMSSATNVSLHMHHIEVDRKNSDYSAGEGKESAMITGLRPASTYILRIASINKIDMGSFTDTLLVKTQEDAPMEAPMNIKVKSISSSELLVTWQPPPRDSWNGELLGYIVWWREADPKSMASSDAEERSSNVIGAAANSFAVAGLSQYTRYFVAVAAFNSAEHGPRSLPISAITLEGVPEAPPGDISCESSSPVSVRVWWIPPPSHLTGGLLQGYKVHYTPILTPEDGWDMASGLTSEVKRAGGTETVLSALRRYTKYSIRVRAYTAAGDGVPSHPITCTTDEDAPGKPAGLKAMALTGDSILASWLPPEKANGLILHYTLYMREAARSDRPISITVPVTDSRAKADYYHKPVTINEITHTVQSLRESITYEFWVTATTEPGEGEPSDTVKEEPKAKAPARIASFGGDVFIGAGGSAVLRCAARGTPSPRVQWSRRGTPLSSLLASVHGPNGEQARLVVTQENHLVITRVDSSVSDNYTCVARNPGGVDSVTYWLRVLSPPPPPSISALASSRPRRALELRLAPPMEADRSLLPIEGYTLYYKHETGEWQSMDLPADTTSYTLQDLKCGSVYHIYVTSNNRVGSGIPSDVITAQTKGGVPIMPSENDFLSANSTALKLNMFLWEDSGCPIRAYQIEYRPLGAPHWIRFENGVSTADNAFVSALEPSKWYQLKVSMTNEAGITVGNYKFATTTMDGGRIAAPGNFPGEPGYFDDTYNGTLLVVAFCIITALAALTIALFMMRKHRYIRDEATLNDKSEQDNFRNCHALLHSKSDTTALDDSFDRYEISPYATFSMADNPVEGRPVNHIAVSERLTNHDSRPANVTTPGPVDYSLQLRTFSQTDEDLRQHLRPGSKHRCCHDKYSMSNAETVRVGSRKHAYVRGGGHRGGSRGAFAQPPAEPDSESDDSGNTESLYGHQPYRTSSHHPDTEM